MKPLAIILIILVLAALVGVGYLYFTSNLTVTFSSVVATDPVDQAEAFDQVRTSVENETFIGTKYSAEQLAAGMSGDFPSPHGLHSGNNTGSIINRCSVIRRRTSAPDRTISGSSLPPALFMDQPQVIPASLDILRIQASATSNGRPSFQNSTLPYNRCIHSRYTRVGRSIR